MARRRLRQQAAQQAAAQAAPQRHAIQRQLHSTRRDTRQQTRSIRSMNTAQQEAIDAAMRDVRHTSGLMPRDQASAITALAQARVSSAAGASFATGQVRQDAAATRKDLRSSLVDLSAEQGKTAQSILADTLAAQKSRQADQADALQAHKWEVKGQRQSDARAAQAARRAPAMTPTQRLNAENSRQAAIAAAAGLAAVHVPTNAAEWQILTDKVSQARGVDSIADAQKAVDKLRKQALQQILAQQIGAGARGEPNPAPPAPPRAPAPAP